MKSPSTEVDIRIPCHDAWSGKQIIYAAPIDPPAGSAFGHRIQHPRYEETVGMDLALTEIAPQHMVAADPCCLSADDWRKVDTTRQGA